MCTRINHIQKTGEQVVIIRGDDQAHIYYPSLPSLVRLTRVIRSLTPNLANVLPFSDGWTVCLNPSYHKALLKKLNISGTADV